MLGLFTFLHRLLSPLIHLNFALQAVAIVCNYTEIVVNYLNCIFCSASHMHELILVGIVGVVAVHRFHGLLAQLHALSEGHNFLLVFPKHDQGEWDCEAAKYKARDAPIIFAR